MRVEAVASRTAELAPRAVGSRSVARSLIAALRQPGFALAILSSWAAAGLFFAGQSWINDHFTGRAFDSRSELVTPLVDMLLWAPLTPLVVFVCRRAPFERGRRRAALLVHLPALLVLSASHAVAAGAIFWSLGFFAGKGYPLGPLLGALILCKSAQNAVAYGALAALVHALDFHRRMRDREVHASQLEARLAEARLHLLRMQLQPHFLFNTLHAISALIPRDPAGADRMLIRLSALLRLSMQQDRSRGVPLAREIEVLHAYLDIQTVRFGDRLRVSWDLEPAALAVPVPPLLLQPLVENAVQHGIGDRSAGGGVHIAARIDGAALRIDITDDGRGLTRVPPIEGRGLGNTRARLAEFAPGAADLEIATNPAGGTRVTVRVPAAAPRPEVTP
jgi:hypothetical protein